MHLHLVDGTYELFRAYYGPPAARSPSGMEVGATRGLLRSLLALLRDEGATHVGVAFDHVVESFRNDLFSDYKDGSGVEPELMAQFPLAERAAFSLGIVVWPMIEFEADDALASAAARWARETEVERIYLCTPDKDLAQCVQGQRIVMLDRRRGRVIDEAGVVEKYGVPPASIPDWLALVGDAADGIPGVPRWGAKTTATVLRRYPHIDAIPDDEREWEVSVRGTAGLAASLRAHRNAASLYRTLATLRTDVSLEETLASLAWRGARRRALAAFCEEIGDREFLQRVPAWRRGS